MMRLFTKEQFDELCNRGRPGNHGRDWPPLVKFLLPGTACVWMLSEIVHSNNKAYGYGIADYGHGSTHDGYIDIAILEVMSDPLERDHVQQDPAFVPDYGISVYLTAARMNSRITDDPDDLLEACFLMLDKAREAEQAAPMRLPMPQP